MLNEGPEGIKGEWVKNERIGNHEVKMMGWDKIRHPFLYDERVH
jgi:hypothetical protein